MSEDISLIVYDLQFIFSLSLVSHSDDSLLNFHTEAIP